MREFHDVILTISSFVCWSILRSKYTMEESDFARHVLPLWCLDQRHLLRFQQLYYGVDGSTVSTRIAGDDERALYCNLDITCSRRHHH